MTCSSRREYYCTKAGQPNAHVITFPCRTLAGSGIACRALNVVTGEGKVVGDKLVTDPRVTMITFTGSPGVGTSIRNRAGLKRVTLELGSNAAVNIDKGVDIDKIIQRCVTGAFSNQGQVCSSLQRIYVHQEVYDPFVKKFIEATGQLNLGDPLDLETDVSALITPQGVQRTLHWIEEAKQYGAKIVTGSKAEGNILHPTVILEADASLKLSCQEVFAPIVLIYKIQSVEEGIHRVNASRFGLQAGIYTENVYAACWKRPD